MSFNSSSITANITGPCPDTMILVGVGPTIQYRCNYESSVLIFPYWHTSIPELSGSAFVSSKEAMNYDLSIDSTLSEKGHTIVSIPVKDQYLYTTLSIQCI